MEARLVGATLGEGWAVMGTCSPDCVPAWSWWTVNAYRDHDLDAARAAHAELIADADACGARAATAHLRAATEEVFTFLTLNTLPCSRRFYVL